MRIAALVPGCIALALVTSASAQPVPAPRPPPPPDEAGPSSDDAALQALVARGEQLAIDKDYAGAIAVWKEADRAAPRALHACLIGRAYTRRGLWPQAELSFAECRRRATAEHPAPGWLDTAERDLAAQIERAGAAAVTIVVEPAIDGARVQLSGFAPDESFAPGTIHLSPGRHTVSVSAPDQPVKSETFDVDGPEARTITIALGFITPPPPPPPPGRERVIRSRVPWIVVGAGGALALAGGIYHGTVLRGAWDDLESTTDRGFYDGEGDRAWRAARRNTIILYGAGAAAIGAGLALRALGVGDRREAPGAMSVGVAPVAGGGVVTVGWER